MKKNIQYQFGASLFALAFSLVGADEAWAQTCVPSPSCDTLGFTKTAADCAGKTILKCPFDTTKVYCPGAEEQGDNPFVSTWELGTSVVYNGKEIGIIFEDRGATVMIHNPISTRRNWNVNDLKSYCSSLGIIGNNAWRPMQSQVELKALLPKVTALDSVGDIVGAVADNSNLIYCAWSGSCHQSSTQYGYAFCVVSIPKTL